MKHRLKLLVISLLGASLGACALLPVPGQPEAQKVMVDGETYLLTQITESTWTANSRASLKILPATEASTVALRQAVEKTSGCKVTDSDYSRQGRQFDAQVDCGGLRK